MSLRLGILAILVASLAGCAKEESAAPTVSPSTSASGSTNAATGKPQAGSARGAINPAAANPDSIIGSKSK